MQQPQPKQLFADLPSKSPWRSQWSLDPRVTFLNHGSFGACPIAVLKQQQQFRQQLEAEPLRFFEDTYEPLLDRSRQRLAEFIGATPQELAFIPNATTGVNTVLRSLSFRADDELLTTNHEYNACRNVLDFVAETSGATVVVAEVPFPLESSEQVIEAVLARLTEKTRIVLLDHVTSQTGLIFPIRSLAQQFRAADVEVMVDGAHAPGMVPLNLKELGVTYYTGNCHKWLCSPKGAAFLYVCQEKQAYPEKQPQIRPLVISHGANTVRTDRSRFHLEFDWTGTSDPTAYCCVAAAIDWMDSQLPGGWNAIMAQNQQLAIRARQILCHALGVSPPCPDTMIGSMAAIPLPASLTSEGQASRLQRQLFDRFQIEVPLIPWRSIACRTVPFPDAAHSCEELQSDRLIRVSAQLYNSPADYDRLAEALLTLLAESASAPADLRSG